MGIKISKFKRKTKKPVNNISEPTNRNRKQDFPLPQQGIRVRALYHFLQQDENDLSFNKGDILFVTTNFDGPWWYAKHSITQKTGYIPSNYVVEDNGSPTSLDSWFDIGRCETEKKLIHPGYPDGTFIIRPSADAENFALSIRNHNVARNIYEVRHYKIRSLDAGGYYISPKMKFNDIHELISYYSRSSSGLCCKLSEAFPRHHKPPIQFKEMEVNRDCLSLERKLGNGSFGEVWLARWNKSIEVAVKMVKTDSTDANQRKSFLEEARLMHKLNHPRIVEILGVCSEPEDKPLFIITELMINGALLTYLQNDQGNTLTLKDLILMMNQIADGMSYLESKNFIHRDLRAANILVAEDGSVKVADFGLARVIEDVYEADQGSKFPIKWTAPEAVLQRKFTVKSDVWSFGVLIYEIVTYGCSPYKDLQARTVVYQIESGYRMPNPNGGKVRCPTELYDIMMSCWDINPNQRPTFSHLRDVFEEFFISTERQYDQNS